MSIHSPPEEGTKKEGDSIVALSRSRGAGGAVAGAEAVAEAAKRGHVEETKIIMLTRASINLYLNLPIQ